MNFTPFCLRLYSTRGRQQMSDAATASATTQQRQKAIIQWLCPAVWSGISSALSAASYSWCLEIRPPVDFSRTVRKEHSHYAPFFDDRISLTSEQHNSGVVGNLAMRIASALTRAYFEQLVIISRVYALKTNIHKEGCLKWTIGSNPVHHVKAGHSISNCLNLYQDLQFFYRLL